MRSLLSLPDELLLLVVVRIEDHGDAVSLAMAHRHLYEMTDLLMRRRFRRVRFLPAHATRRALDKVLQILKNPHLGGYVRHIELDCFRRNGPVEYFSMEGVDSEDLSMLCQAIRNADIIDEDDEAMLARLFPPMPQYFRRRNRSKEPGHETIEILAALLASLSAGVTSISCCDLGVYIPKVRARQEGNDIVKEENENTGSWSHFGRFLQRAGQLQGQTRYLQKLRAVHFLSDTSRYHDERAYGETDYYHALNVIRRLPALKSVRFDASTDSRQSMSVRPPPRSANYSELAFHHSTISFPILQHILHSPKALKRLEIFLGKRWVRGGHFHPMFLDRLLKTLLAYRGTLEYVDIDFENSTLFSESFSNWDPNYIGGEELSPLEEAEYEEEWDDELPELASDEKDYADSTTEKPAQSLRNLHSLKHLGLGIYSLYYLARGFDPEMIHRDSFSLVDQIPPKLESLRIYGVGQRYSIVTEEMELKIKWHVSQLVLHKTTKLPLLKNLEGVDEPIPNGESVRYPDQESHILWEREIDEWTEPE